MPPEPDPEPTAAIRCCPREPTASSWTRRVGRSATRSRSTTAAGRRRRPTSRRTSTAARVQDPSLFSADAAGSGPGYRAAAYRLTDGSTLVVAIPLTELSNTLGRLSIDRRRGHARRCSPRMAILSLVDRAARPAAAGADRADRRGDRGRRPVASRRGDRPAHRGRAAGRLAQRDARPHRGGDGRAARAPRRRSGGSWPTPRTSCAPRSPRSAATPSCSAGAPRMTRTTPRSRCVASSRRANGWACSSRTCCSSRARARDARSRMSRSTFRTSPPTRSMMRGRSILRARSSWRRPMS